ncbi:MAG: hypothetical protein ACD_10C00693G0002 [uncultured bacterium]|nr:MAG: hypothetical protein ACD_10C00693G0002 [uncultured bacterium]
MAVMADALNGDFYRLIDPIVGLHAKERIVSRRPCVANPPGLGDVAQKFGVAIA